MSSSGDDSFLRELARSPERDPPDDKPPERMGHFRIVERIGKGGMGVVYRAVDERLGRDVALKVLPAAFEADSDRRRRFLREARTAAAVTHPNLITVHEIGEADSRIFIAMELVTGRTLRRRLDEGRVPVDEALRIAREVSRGVAVAHDRGVIHRDLKPDNVMLGDDGTVKVLDFGLAKRRASDPQSADTQTEEGRIVGTPEYMSPEQAAGIAVDERSDVFALGVTFYELWSGQRPFSGRSSAEVIASVLRDTPKPLRRVAPDVPGDIEAFMVRCLAKSPADRWANARAVLDALNELEALSTAAPGASDAAGAAARGAARSSWLRRSATIVAAALVASGVLALVRSRDRHVPPTSSVPESAAARRPARRLTDWPPPKTSSPEAAAVYAAGLQAFHDGSLEAGLRHMTRATQLDPHFAAAFLRLVLMRAMSGDEQGRRALVSALESRALLDARDARFLSLAQAAMHTPPSRDDAAAKARALAKEMPDDPEAQYWAALPLPSDDEILAQAARAVALDPTFATVEELRGEVLSNRGDFAGVVAATERCLAISPSAVTCIRLRADAHRELGDCAALAAEARQLITLDPDGDQGYEYLLTALAAQDAPPETLRELARKAESKIPNAASAHALAAAHQIRIALYEGDFRAVDAAVSALIADYAAANDEGVHFPWLYEMGMDLEEGDAAKATRDAEDYLKRRVGWVYDGMGLTRGYALAIQRRLGRISSAEARAKRDAWIAEDRRLGVGETELWIAYYGLPAVTPAEAREALAALASPLRLYIAGGGNNWTIGHTYLLAGEVDRALPYLRAAATWCGFASNGSGDTNGVGWQLVMVWAHHTLGLALEQKGDKPGACAEYARVLRRWGNTRSRSVTAEDARRRSHALGCPDSTLNPSSQTK